MRWVRPAVPLVGEVRSILLSSLWAESLFVFNLFTVFIRCFHLFYFGFDLFSKVEKCVLGLSFVFLVFY